MAWKKICKGRKEREEKMRRTMEDERSFSAKVKWSKVARIDCVHTFQQKKEMMSTNKCQALYLYILDMIGKLNVDAMSLKIELGYKAEQLT